MTVNGIRSCVLAASFLPVLLLAQQLESSASGVVVNSATGEPIRQAVVSVHCFASRTSEPPDSNRTNLDKEVFTDSAGAFRFDAIPPRLCFFTIQKPQFAPVREDEEQGITRVDLTTSKEGLRFRLLPLGVITGKVVDQNGQPVYRANVVCLSVSIQTGMREIRINRSVTTDDRGIYRFSNLERGKYFIQATGLAGATALFAGDTTPMHLVNESFAPVYFGGGNSMESADPIEIEAGTKTQANFSVDIEQAYKVRGSLTNFASRRTAVFELWSGEENVSPARVSINGDTGRFEILDVLPGSYLLHAKQGNATGELLLTVKDSDIDGLSISLTNPTKIPVLTRFINPAKTVSVGNREVERKGYCAPSLFPVSKRNKADSGIPILEERVDGLVLENVSPGKYQVGIQCSAGYATSASSGTQDLLRNPEIVVQPGTSPSPIEITAVHGGSTLHGTVTSKDAIPTTRAAVLLVPQFPTSNGPQVSEIYRDPSGNHAYNFFFSDLAPGNYIVYAFSRNEGIEFHSSQFLQSLPKGTPVRVESDEPVSVTVTEFVR